MRFYKKITELTEVNNQNLKTYTTIPNIDKLQAEITNFNNEIDWKEMWNIEDAQKRLNDNWIIITLEIENKIQGWVWLDVNNKFLQNLYVNKTHRNKGFATDLVGFLSNFAKKNKINKLKTYVDDWNLPSQQVFFKCGWKKKDD